MTCHDMSFFRAKMFQLLQLMTDASKYDSSFECHLIFAPSLHRVLGGVGRKCEVQFHVLQPPHYSYYTGLYIYVYIYIIYVRYETALGGSTSKTIQRVILLMEEILHHLGWLKPYK